MIYLLTMSLFALIGFLIGKFRQNWPWFWLITLPVGMCAAIMIADHLTVPPSPAEVSFGVLLPIFLFHLIYWQLLLDFRWVKN